jgi:hypothetical protein
MRETGNHRQARLAFVRVAKEFDLICSRPVPANVHEAHVPVSGDAVKPFEF